MKPSVALLEFIERNGEDNLLSITIETVFPAQRPGKRYLDTVRLSYVIEENFEGGHIRGHYLCKDEDRFDA